MAKKFVRGITDIKTIEHQDFDTNNVNDLLSDGKHNYIHRKKQDGSEEYHNLTNNIKTIEAEDNGLLTVINYNNSTNKAKLTVNHDPQKEQKIYSTDHTIEIVHGDNGTGELTNVDVNFDKVQEKLTAGDGLSIIEDTISLKILEPFSGDLNDLTYTSIAKPVDNALNLPSGAYGNGVLSTVRVGDVVIQKYHPFTGNKVYIRSCRHLPSNPTWGNWSEEVDKTTIENLLAQKQNTLTSNASIGVAGTGLRQLYTNKETYTHSNGILKTYVKSVANSASASTIEEEFNFLAKMNKSQTNAEFTLNAHDTAVFQYLIDTYGVDNKINVCGSLFTLNGSQLTFGSNGAQYNPHIINFSDIIPASAINPTQ